MSDDRYIVRNMQVGDIWNGHVQTQGDIEDWTAYRWEPPLAVIDTHTGAVIGIDGGEPEDQTLARDWRWVAPALNAAYQAGLADEGIPQ